MQQKADAMKSSKDEEGKKKDFERIYTHQLAPRDHNVRSSANYMRIWYPNLSLGICKLYFFRDDAIAKSSSELTNPYRKRKKSSLK